MPVDQTSLDRIRNATFPSSRRGYDKHEVEKFLARLADWLETGAGDESRSDTVKRELERVGQRTGAILSQAEESAQQIRAEAEEEARGTINTANMEATETRAETERYASETRGSADAYAQQTRQEADEVLSNAKAEAERLAREAIEGAQAEAHRIVEEGIQRREDIEAVIADLVRRRNEVLADTEELTAKLTGAVSEHRPEAGGDPFDAPEQLDPLARDEGEGDLQTAEEQDAETAMQAEEEPVRGGIPETREGPIAGQDVAEERPDRSTEETQVVDAESEQEART
jgi:DivIVA domain-containing protein